MSKKKTRISKALLEKEENQKVLEYMDEIKDFSENEIFDFSQSIYEKKKIDQENAIKLKSMKKLVSQKSKVPLVDTYPLLEDDKFSKKIFEKKEFYIDKIPKIDQTETIDSITKKLCKFKLSPNQKFLKKYLSENTNYNGILLYHGTGVGKTCSSISIAEQFIERLDKLNKKVIILLNPSIKANFIKNIFNIEKLKQGEPLMQCTRDKYLKLLNVDIKTLKTEEDYEKINKRIKRLIKNKYAFYGYQEFANYVEKMENIETPGLSQDYKNKLVLKKYQKMFSNTVMIIDEAHNIKENNSSKDMKVLPPIIKRVLQNSINMKLVLLTATPMYDSPSEIVFLLNLLLMNDKRELVKKSDIFDKKDNLKLKGQQLLYEKSRGYISYLRGEHPIKFPKKLFPSIYNDPLLIKNYPNKDINGDDITEPIKTLEIMGCNMSGIQLETYTKLQLKSEEQDFGPFNLNGMMISNIVYPVPKETSGALEKTSKKGFDAIFSKKKKKYVFKDNVNENMFDLKNFKQYSAKLSSIIENISKSEGIVFIYSQFIYAGIMPLAMALEANGYNNFSGNLMDNVEPSDKKYLLITGDNELSSNAYENYLKVENDNINGEKVKVIIGSSSAAEGLDFKYIREVHILEPWHHLNKLDQVVGRAIRNCSHISLPVEKRNVLVYYYASMNPESKNETIDLKLYRTAEEKSRKIAKVAYVLKRNAVDCNLNKEENVFNNDFYKQLIQIETSRKTKHSITLADVDKSRECMFRDCDYKCISNNELKPEKFDESTYDYNIMVDYYYDILDMMRTILEKNTNVNINTIKKEFLKNYDEDYIDLLYITLDKLVANNEYLDNSFNVLRRKNNIYYKIHESKKNVPMSFSDLRIKTKKKLRGLDITNTKISSTSRQIKTKKVASTTDIEDKLRTLDENKLSLIEMDKNFSDEKKNSMKSLYLSMKHEILFDYYDDKVSLIKHALKTRDPKYIKMVSKDLLYVKRDIDRSHIDASEIFGYKIVNNKTIDYYTIDHKLVNEEDLKKIKKMVMLKDEKPNKLIGYLEMKKDNILLKIRDTINQGIKGTQIKTGSVCGNEGMKKGKIIEFLQYVTNNKELYKNLERNQLPGKPNLCFELELLLRNYDELQKNEERWFYNLSDTIESQVNKKI